MKLDLLELSFFRSLFESINKAKYVFGFLGFVVFLNYFIFKNFELTIIEIIIIMPLIGFFIVLLLDNKNINFIKDFSLYYSFLILIVIGILWNKFDSINGRAQFESMRNIFDGTNIYYHVAVDGISIWFILLTAILIPICLLANWKSITYRVKESIALYFLIEFLLFNVFFIMDIFLFYIFFESILIPMFCLIGIWGSRERKIHAGYQFFLYTIGGSVLMLLGLLLIYFEVGTTNWYVLQSLHFTDIRGLFIWIVFFLAFAVKVPMFPLHIWLPEAHVEAPTGGSVLLAGILLKMGTFGMLRYCVQLMPIGTQYFTPLVLTMSILGIIYGSLSTIRQIDLKKSIAYSSVAHMSFVTLGLVVFTIQSIEGAIYMMIGHGLVSSALFLCVGVLYDRYHTRLLIYYGGLIFGMPVFAIIFYFFTLSNINFPGTSNFVAELLISLGVARQSLTVLFLACIGMILGAVYAVWLYNRIFFGTIRNTYYFADINRREFYVLLPLILGTLVFGFCSETIITVCHKTVVYYLYN